MYQSRDESESMQRPKKNRDFEYQMPIRYVESYLSWPLLLLRSERKTQGGKMNILVW